MNMSGRDFMDMSENGYYYEILERQRSNHQAVPEQDDSLLDRYSSSYYFEDPSRFTVRSREKSNRIINPELKLSKEVEFTVPDEESAAVGSCYFSEDSTDTKNDETSEKIYDSEFDDSTSTYLTDDSEEDSYCFTREVPSLESSGSKRKRIAETHSLCEKRQREKVNKKIHTLQELIPNCNKPDQASVLDMAIVYLKNLQLQIQMMSMATRSYMHPFTPLMGIQHINPKPYFNNFNLIAMSMLMGQGYNPLLHGFVSMASSPQTTMFNLSASSHFHLPSFMDFRQQTLFYPDFMYFTESSNSLQNREFFQEGGNCYCEKK